MKSEISCHILEFGRRKIPYRFQRSERKRLRIIIRPDLTVDVLAPITAVENEVHSAVTRKAPWIAKVIDKFETYHPMPSPRHFMSGETLVYLGRQYRLKVEEGPRQMAKLVGRFLLVWAEDKSDAQAIRRAVEGWYRKHARIIFGRHMEECRRIASRHGVPESSTVVRAMRTRWGSCSPSGRITLNANLVQVPVHCIEYVIMHEICHLKHRNHSKAFYALLTRCQPDWRQRKHALDKFRPS
jgi:predicted metal-dependent hydrolase